MIDVNANTFEKMKVYPTDKLQETYDIRKKEFKQMKSGRKYHRNSLRQVGLFDEFHNYLEAVGFQQLLDLEDERVPTDLALEFFTTFRFKATPDLTKESISFRAFNREWRMSIDEWSCRMGLYTEEEFIMRVWKDRHVGTPGSNKAFNSKKAWKELTKGESGEFKASQSHGLFMADPALRFAQVFLGYNLLGQTSPVTTITNAELYFTWCMKNRVQLHLGYWMAFGLHQIAVHPSHHMNSCHILGAFVQRNMVIEYTEGTIPTTLCPAPTLFDLNLFINTNLVKKIGDELHLYEVGVAITGTGVVKKDDDEEIQAAPEDWKAEVQSAVMTLAEVARDQKEALMAQTQQLTMAVTLMKQVADAVLQRSSEAKQDASGTSKATAGSDAPPS